MIWLTTSKHLVRLLPTRDRDRFGTELIGTLEDTQAARSGNIGATDAMSIGWLVTRRWMLLGTESLPLVLAGIPIGAFAFVAILGVVDSHFVPWDVFNDIQSTTPVAVAVRAIVDRIVPIALVLCLLAGARAVQYLRRGSYHLPAALIAASFLAATQHQIFLERTEWAFTNNLAPASVNQVSPYSVLLLAISLSIPAGFLTIDFFTSTRSNRKPLPPFALKTTGPLFLGLTATSLVVVPYLTPAMVPFIWMTNLSRKTKVITTVLVLALVAWVGIVIYIDD